MCGISIPDIPEDASHEEMLCNACHEKDEFIKGLVCPKCENNSDYYEAVIKEIRSDFSVQNNDINYEGDTGEPQIIGGNGIYCGECHTKVAENYNQLPWCFI